MAQTLTSSNGDCPLCKSGNWKTLEALALSDRTRAQSKTNGHRYGHHRETAGSEATEAAALHAPPQRPADYDQLARYRKECAAAIAAAKARLAEIDAAWQEPKKALPNLLRGGPEANERPFERNARKLAALQEYEANLAVWKATRACLRCAATFTEANAKIEAPATMLFRFAGQERRCPHCQSYFWKDPTAVVAHHKQQAEAALARAQQLVCNAEDAEREAAAKPEPRGILKRLAAFLTPSPISVDTARAALAYAKQDHQRAMDMVLALRRRFEGREGVRWCVVCEEVYSGTSASGTDA